MVFDTIEFDAYMNINKTIKQQRKQENLSMLLYCILCGLRVE